MCGRIPKLCWVDISWMRVRIRMRIRKDEKKGNLGTGCRRKKRNKSWWGWAKSV